MNTKILKLEFSSEDNANNANEANKAFVNFKSAQIKRAVIVEFPADDINTVSNVVQQFGGNFSNDDPTGYDISELRK